MHFGETVSNCGAIDAFRGKEMARFVNMGDHVGYVMLVENSSIIVLIVYVFVLVILFSTSLIRID